MSSYYQPETSLNIFDSGNVVSLLKFYGVNILLSIVLSLIILLILSTAGPGVLGGVLLFLAVFMGQLYTIRLFERWDGCYFKQDATS